MNQATTESGGEGLPERPKLAGFAELNSMSYIGGEK
jgi:hypothetical protein